MRAVRRFPRGALAFAWCGAAVFATSLLFFLYSYLIRFGAHGAHGGAGPGALAAAAIDVALFSIFAAHHSLLARPRVKRHLVRAIGPALERSAYTWTASLLFLLVCWWWQPVPGALYHLAGPAAIGGYAVQVLGIAATLAGSARLDVLELAGVRQVLESEGNRQPLRTRLETRGLYGVVRHPVYLAWVLFVFGAPHMTLTRLVFALTSTAYIALAIRFEERGLLDAFGAEYRAYQQRVRWRLIPGLY